MLSDGKEVSSYNEQKDPMDTLPKSEPPFSSAVKRTAHLGLAGLCGILAVNIY